MGKGQAHLELSLNIIDFASESFTSWKKTSHHILDPHKTPAFIVHCLSLPVIPVGRPSPASLAELIKCPQSLPTGPCLFKEGESSSQSAEDGTRRIFIEEVVTVEINLKVLVIWSGRNWGQKRGGHHRGYQIIV